MHIFHIVGARPNFMKAAPVISALKRRKHVVQTLIHTGQHYDATMSEVFFEQLGMPSPDINLAVGSGTHAVADRGDNDSFRTRSARAET